MKSKNIFKFVSVTAVIALFTIMLGCGKDTKTTTAPKDTNEYLATK